MGFLKIELAADWARQDEIQAIQFVRTSMPKKRPKLLADAFVLPAERSELPPSGAEELWVRPNYNLRQENQRPSEGNITPERGQRLLELADIALGLKKPASAKRKSKALSAEAHHQKVLQQKRKRPQESS
jgi:hypothetical protein